VKEVDISSRRGQLKNFCLSQLGKLFDAGQFDKFVYLLERGNGQVSISFKLVLSEEVIQKLKESNERSEVSLS